MPVEDLTRDQVIGRSARIADRVTITLRIRKTGNAFASFAPQDLALVGKDGVQIAPLCELNGSLEKEALARRIAPGAAVEVRFILSGKFDLPAQVHLAGTLVAIIQE